MFPSLLTKLQATENYQQATTWPLFYYFLTTHLQQLGQHLLPLTIATTIVLFFQVIRNIDWQANNHTFKDGGRLLYALLQW